MIKYFQNVEGNYIEKIDGQERFAYSQSDMVDFYELAELMEHGGYRGSTIKFYDLYSGAVYSPFEEKQNVAFGNPVYSRGLYYFLKADYNEEAVILYSCYPGKTLETVREFELTDLSMYNLRVIGDEIHVISEDDALKCYYPEQFSFRLGEHESVVLIDQGIVYCQKWIETGWNHEKNCRDDDYRYYDRIVLRNFKGKVISEKNGSLFHNSDGTWWVS